VNDARQEGDKNAHIEKNPTVIVTAPSMKNNLAHNHQHPFFIESKDNKGGE
jgi:hypothetical protein